MRIAVTGSNGFLGSALGRSLRADGHEVVPVVRSEPTRPGPHVRWDIRAGTIEAPGLEGLDGVVHLAGEGIASGRFTADHRREVRDSRTRGTDLLASALAGLDRPPPVLLSGSAIGYYGDRGDEELTEQSPPGTGFLPEVCVAWEAAAAPAAEAGIRVAHLRTGIVLSPEGGALGKQLLPFKLGLGGPAGKGDQWLPWVTLDDHVAAMRFLLGADVAGAVDVTAPHPVTSKEFARTLGRVLGRPAVVPIPRVITKLPLGIGPLAENLLFTSAKVLPRVLLDAGFAFGHDRLEPALRSLLDR